MFHIYLGEVIPNSAEWVQAICAVGVLFLTGLMAYYARKALTVWRDQDTHNTIMELVREANSTKEFLTDLRNHFSNVLTQEKKDDIARKFDKTAFRAMKTFNLEEKLKDQSKIDEINRMSVASIALLKNTNPLRRYYTYVDQLIVKIKQSNKIYGILISDWKERREERKLCSDNLLELKKYSESDFRHHPASGEYNSWSDAISAYEADLKRADENYRSTTDEMHKLEDLLFPSFLSKPDEISKEIDEHYEGVKKYIASYSNPKSKL